MVGKECYKQTSHIPDWPTPPTSQRLTLHRNSSQGVKGMSETRC